MTTHHQDRAVAIGTAPPARAQRQTVLWIIAILLAVIATCLLTRSDLSFVKPAFGDSSIAGARGIFAFTGQLDKNRYGLFMMDVDNASVWCYEYLPGTRKLKLVAARSFNFDRYLEDYQTDEPSPEQVRIMLNRQREAKNRNNGYTGDDGKPLSTEATGLQDLGTLLNESDSGTERKN
jgi:hypothetical protein